jgi:hypothetical protein
MTLDELVAKTRTKAASIDPLDLLATASRQQQELTDMGEELLDYWVQHARAAGCSWAQIGGSLGVTKQAAQQRHSAARGLLGKLKGRVADAGAGLFNGFDPAARRVVVLAQEEARTLRHNFLGTEHLLLGLLAETDSVAATVLDTAGITRDAARAAVERIVGCGQGVPRGHIPFTPRAKQVLVLSLRESRELGHHHIGTGHILLGLLTEGGGLGTQVLTEGGVALGELRGAVLARLES